MQHMVVDIDSNSIKISIANHSCWGDIMSPVNQSPILRNHNGSPGCATPTVFCVAHVLDIASLR